MKLSTWLCAILALAGSAMADTVYLGTLKLDDVKITGIAGDTLTFELRGNPANREIAKITKIAVTDDKGLTEAEEAYSTQKWDVAVDNYQKAIKSPSKPWVKDWASLRLVDAASKTGRFDAATTAYIALVKKDLAMAAASRPKMPDASSTYLDTAAAQTEAALKEAGLKDDQKKALLQFALDIYTVKKDSAKAAVKAEELVKIGGADNPRVIVNLAQFAFDAKDFKKALTQIESKRALFTDPASQMDALYLLAQCNYELAKDVANPAEKEKALNDTALAYMRVVTHFKDQDKEKAADSLLKVGKIHDELKLPDDAQRTYKQVVDEFPGTAAAAAAKGLIRSAAAAK